MQPDVVIWLSQIDHQKNCEEARRLFALETGGAYMGYWANEHEVVVTKCIAAGPNAVHTRYSFEPDYRWQQAAIAEHYEASGRRETYLGDWHTHPDGITGQLSRDDKRVLRRIAASRTARAPRPIMSIYYGGRDDWGIENWAGHLEYRTMLWPKLIIFETSLELY